jgi:hypothetical protein
VGLGDAMWGQRAGCTQSLRKLQKHKTPKMRRHYKTAVVLIDCGFVSLMYATTTEVVMDTTMQNLNG